MAVDHGRDAVAPHVRIIRGEPTPEELAAVTALMTAAAATGDEPAAPPQRGRWNDPAALHRRPLHPGPGAWRAAVR